MLRAIILLLAMATSYLWAVNNCKEACVYMWIGFPFICIYIFKLIEDWREQ